MRNEEMIILKDKFKVDDSHSKIRGFVFFYDDDDYLILAHENMITKEGRKSILDAFMNTDKSISDIITCALLSSDYNPTTSNMTYEDISKSTDLVKVSIDNPLYDETNLTLTFNINLKDSTLTRIKPIDKDTSNFKIGSLALANNDNVIFSRVSFPQKEKSANNNYKIKYVIYF